MTKILKEYRMKFQRTSSEKDGIDPQALGLRSKLGGKPSWEQCEEIPLCPSCNDEMTFIAQIDSMRIQIALTASLQNESICLVMLGLYMCSSVSIAVKPKVFFSVGNQIPRMLRMVVDDKNNKAF